ncbi:hypothetical protein N7478_012733 [Penicillium angulare]|uniref:uncharacterized protein n=1 Tax=Penicillium angulare TaxID=116970 RepID=UPI00253F7463|nr:uncharacterized protein N7478_012733 [Penicillium angulare]KAJ5256629.1 hypothetical protein N7478_012733 [Penicillium angulare]
MWWRSFLRLQHETITGDKIDVDHTCLAEDFATKKEFCQSLETRGLLYALSSGELEDIGFTFDWSNDQEDAGKRRDASISRKLYRIKVKLQAASLSEIIGVLLLPRSV